MADAKTEEAPKKKSKLPLIIIAAVLLLGGGGGAGWYFFLKPKPAVEGEADSHASAEEDSHKPKARRSSRSKRDEHAGPRKFVTLEPFTINLQDEEQDRFAQIGLVFEIEDATVEGEITSLSPAIRNAILIIMTSKTSEELLTVAGKQELADQVALATNAILDGDRPPPVRKRKPMSEQGQAGKDKHGSADGRDGDYDRRDRRDREPDYPERVTAVNFSQFIVQ